MAPAQTMRDGHSFLPKMSAENPEMITVSIGEIKVQFQASNTFELLDSIRDNFKMNPKLISLFVNGVLVDELACQAIFNKDSILVEIVDSNAHPNVKQGLELEKLEITSLMLKKFADYRILKSKSEQRRIDYERKLSEITMREDARKQKGYIGTDIERYMRSFQNCSKEDQLTQRHAYERLDLEAQNDAKEKQLMQQFFSNYARGDESLQLSNIRRCIEDYQKMLNILNDLIQIQ